MATEKKKEEESTGGRLMPSVEYDASLTDLLVKNKFTYKWMVDICPPPDSRVLKIRRSEMMVQIGLCKLSYKTGCIFTMPGDRRDGMMYLYYSAYTSEEIRRIVAMKAFL